MTTLKPTVPTLDYAGWVSDPKSILEKVFSYILLSFHSQDTIFFNEITSLNHVFREDSNPMVISNRLKDDLTTIYSRYFSNVKVNVNIKDLNNDLNQYDLQVFIEGDYNGKIYNVGYALQYTDGTLPKVLSIVNN